MADYYGTLGVDRNASADEIKKAYRKLARKLHPDVAGPDGAEEFKKVTEAYEVLSNNEKRRMYDMGGEEALKGGFAGAGGFGGAGFGGFQDIFSTFFGGAHAQRGPASRVRRGGDSLVELELSLQEVVFGVEKQISVDSLVECSTCEGNMTTPGTHPIPCTNCDGTGSVQRMTNSILGQVMSVTACGACQGYGTVIASPCGDCSGEGRVRAHRTVTVSVPGGVEEGMRIRLQGKGDAGIAGGPSGDLFLEVRIAPDPVFSRQGDNLMCALEVPMTSAALGTTIDINTYDGQKTLKIEPGTQSGSVVRLDGLGVTRLHRHQRGDLHVYINVQTPTKLDDEQRQLLEQLANLRGEKRESKVVYNTGSVFSKIRDKFAGR
ncbi:MAG: molecular chaperone DnaJ [Actinomycetaceae bacterium]|nr:molecular chaperone DnaJ [Actinomycetaceae bacterium]